MTLLTLAFAVLGVVVMGAASLLGMDRLLQKQAEAKVARALHQRSAHYVSHLNDMQRVLHDLATSEDIAQLVASPDPHASQAPDLSPEHHARVLHRLKALMRHQPAYAHIRIIQLAHPPGAGSPQGKVQAPQERVRISRQPGDPLTHTHHPTPFQGTDQPYFQAAIQLAPSQVYLATPLPDQEEATTALQPSQHALLRMIAPLFTRDGETARGLLMIDVTLHALNRALLPTEHDTPILLADRHGHVLDRSEHAGQHPPAHTQQPENLSQIFPNMDFFSAVPLPPEREASEAASHPREPIFVLPPTPVVASNLRVHMAYQHVYFEAAHVTHHMLLIASSSRKHVANTWQTYGPDFLKTALAVLLGLSILIVLTIQRLTRPIGELTHTIQRIAEGEKGVHIAAHGTDEVAKLALAFRTLLEHVHHSNTALQNLATSLEEQVQARTADLAIARDQALEASRAKSHFLTTMSHEIRTPMNVILGMLELLRTSKISLPDKERVELAFGSGNTLLTLINNILDFSRIEAHKITLDKVDFDLRQLIYESAMTVAPLAHAKEVELTAFFPDVPFTAVRGDPIRLKQVFTNLLGNAIKFTSEGGAVELHGGPTNSDERHIDLLFEVRDSGIGILSEDRERIFDQFTQADSSSTRRHEGTGLGLSICKHLVQLMGGEIDVEENAQTISGSVFYFTLHLDKQQQSYVQSTKAQDFKNLRMLAVANDGLQRALVEDVLVPRGARLDHIAELDTVTEILRQAEMAGQPYQLVLCNQKPGKSNQRVFRQLLDLDSDLRFILMTDLLDQGWDQATDMPGTAICLKKPINSERLHAAIEWLINNKGVHQPSQATTPQKNTSWETLYCPGTILIVDDQPANLTVTRSMLTHIGCAPEKILTANNGAEAVKIFRETLFDMVLMDCQMPVMNGFDATEAIHAWEKETGKTSVPIVAFTADVTPQSQEKIHACGMDGFLSKPVTLDALRRQLSRFAMLQPRPPGQRPETLPSDPEEATPPPSPAASPATPPSSPIDMEALLKSMRSIGLQEDDFREVADLLANQFLELLETMQRDLEQQNHPSARATAHVVKGSMANTIFPTLQHATRTLHETVREKNWIRAQKELQHVTQLFLPIQQTLLAFLERAENQS